MNSDDLNLYNIPGRITRLIFVILEVYEGGGGRFRVCSLKTSEEEVVI